MMTKQDRNKRRALIVRCQTARAADAEPQTTRRGRRRGVDTDDPDESSREVEDDRMLGDLPDGLFG
jgi:hypothetical protein